jgi:hypothetical protein
MRSASPAVLDRGRGFPLALNFLPVQVHAGEIVCGRVPFTSSEQLRASREELHATHRLIRRDDDIYVVRLSPEAGEIGELVRLPLPGEGSTIAATLLQDRLSKVVTDRWGFTLRRRYPPKFVSRQRGRDLVPQAAPEVTGLDRLHVYPEYLLDGRHLPATDQVGVLVGVKVRNEIDYTAAELARRGFDLVGCAVMVPTETPLEAWQDPIYARRLVGIVRAVHRDGVDVDTATGLVRMDPARLWVEARGDNVQALLQLLAPKRGRQLYERLGQLIYDQVTGGPARLRRLTELGQNLAARGPLSLCDGVTVSIQTPVRAVRRGGPLRVQQLPEPTFAFDFSGDKTDRYAEQGLTKFGPFDAEAFTPKRPHLVVVTPSQYQGTVEEFVNGLLHGMAGTAFADGLIRRYRLTGATTQVVSFDGPRDAAGYRQACRKALQNNEKIDLAVVVVSASQRQLTGNDSPYLVSKSTFMSQGVPVQEFQYENMRGVGVPHKLKNASLASYAKLGGTPFVVKVQARPMAHELVIGLGSASHMAQRMGPVERSVGITTVFNVDGNYLVANASHEASYDRYPAELLKAMQACIEQVKHDRGWQAKDTVRLIFHVFKPFKDSEARAVKELVDSLAGDFLHVEYAFVNVSEDHPWTIIDEEAAGATFRGGTKGRMTPGRGQALALGPSEMLLSTVGPWDVKTPAHGLPKPLLLHLHRESTFDDLDYLGGQVLRFTAMSWRRPYPSAKPVTIFYSELIAGLLGDLRSVTNWNSDLIGTKLRNSRWFL